MIKPRSHFKQENSRERRVYNVDLVMCCLAAYLFVSILAIWVIRNKVASQSVKQAQAETLLPDDVVLMEEEVAA